MRPAGLIHIVLPNVPCAILSRPTFRKSDDCRRSVDGWTEHPAMNEQTLIGEFLANDSRATAQILEWVAEVIAFHGWGERVDPEEVRQETSLALVRNFRQGSYQSRGGGLKSYVQSVCKNQCLRALRRSYTRREVGIDNLELVSENPGPAEEYEAGERRRLYLRVMQSLELPCRRLLVWKYLKCYSHGEIARRLNVAVGTARVRLHRCLKEAIEKAKKWDEG